MTPALQTITDVYVSLEQGNLGKLLTILDDSILIYTAQCMGGNRRGREGIIQLIPVFYRPGSSTRKKTEQFIEQSNRIIVLGEIEMKGWEEGNEEMSFADIWIFENNKIVSVVFYYRDPEVLCGYLEGL